MSDSSGNVVLRGDLLEIAKTIVIDNNLNANLASVNTSQYKIAGKIVIDSNLNLNVNSLKVESFTPDKLTTGIITASSIVISGKTVLDSNRNINTSNINTNNLTTVNVDTSTIFINGKALVDKSRNINAGNVNVTSLTSNNKTIVDGSGNMPNLCKNLINFFISNNVRIYENMDLTNLNLSGKYMTNMFFNNVNLSNSNLSGTNLTGSTFVNSKLENVDMSGAIVLNAAFINLGDISSVNTTGWVGIPKILLGTDLSLHGIRVKSYQTNYASTGIPNYEFYRSASSGATSFGAVAGVLVSGFNDVLCTNFSDLDTIVKSFGQQANITLVAKCIVYLEPGNYKFTFKSYPCGAYWFDTNDASGNISTDFFITPPPAAGGSPNVVVSTTSKIQTIPIYFPGYYPIKIMYGIGAAFNTTGKNVNETLLFSIEKQLNYNSMKPFESGAIFANIPNTSIFYI